MGHLKWEGEATAVNKLAGRRLGFCLLNELPGGGMVAGYGSLCGRRTFLFRWRFDPEFGPGPRQELFQTDFHLPGAAWRSEEGEQLGLRQQERAGRQLITDIAENHFAGQTAGWSLLRLGDVSADRL